MQALPAEHLVFLDECGVNRSMAPRDRRSRRGERCYREAPRNHGKNMTLLGTLTAEGISACSQVEGATTAEVFTAFLAQVLVPVERPGQVVLLDNLSAHKRSPVKALVAETQAQVVWLPRYSPRRRCSFKAIEQAWSKLKGLLRKWEARTEEALDEAISRAFAAITTSDACAWIRHAGYYHTLE